MDFTIIEWFEKLLNFEHIMIFGTKRGAIDTYLYVREAGADIDCYLVSERLDNPLFIDNKPVKTFRDINENIKKNGLVIISQIYENDKLMRNILFKSGFENVISSAVQITNRLIDKQKEYCLSFLSDMKAVNDFKEVKTVNDNVAKKVTIYAVTSQGNVHKSTKTYKSKYIKYIQAGAKLSNSRICDLTDESGESISELNPFYCELTAGYWIFKNDRISDYVGLYHYSRGLDLDDFEIKKVIKSDIDAVLPFPYITRHEMVTRTGLIAAEIILNAIEKISPDYLQTAERYLMGKIFFAGNIVFSKKKIYCQYYDWMFKILGECIEICKRKSFSLGSRVWGYYGEHLTNIFFIHHIKEYEILYSEVQYMT